MIPRRFSFARAWSAARRLADRFRRPAMIGRLVVDAGLLNVDLLKGNYDANAATLFAKEALRHRLDAIIAHEDAESRLGNHEEALKAAPKTPLPITERARAICRAMERGWKPHPTSHDSSKQAFGDSRQSFCGISFLQQLGPLTPSKVRESISRLISAREGMQKDQDPCGRELTEQWPIIRRDFDIVFGGVARDYQKSALWYAKGAAAGNDRSMTRLGFLYENGLGVQKDYQQAARWYEAAAIAGDIEAMRRVGDLYHTGNLLKRDDLKAASWSTRGPCTDWDGSIKT
jgi:Sel1 repeat